MEIEETAEVELSRQIEQCEERLRIHFASGNYDGVLIECEKLERLDPGNRVARLYRSLAKDKKDQLELNHELGTLPTPVAPAIIATPTPAVSEPPLEPPEAKRTVETPMVTAHKKTWFGNIQMTSPIMIAIIGGGALLFAVSYLFLSLRRSAVLRAQVPQQKGKVPKTTKPFSTGGGEQIAEVVSVVEEEAKEGEEPVVAEITPEMIILEETVTEEGKKEAPAETVVPQKQDVVSPIEPIQITPSQDKELKEGPAEAARESIPITQPEEKKAIKPAEEEIIELPVITKEEEAEEIVPLQALDELLEEAPPSRAEETTGDLTQFSKEYERLVFSDTGQEETLISPSVAYEETLIDMARPAPQPPPETKPEQFAPKESIEAQLEKTIPSKPTETEETIILTEPPETQEKVLLEKEKQIGETQKLEPLSEKEKTPAEEEEVFEKIDLKRLTEVTPEDKKTPPKETIKPVEPEKLEQRQESLFLDQLRRGSEALEKGEWKKAIHYLTIALALKPDNKETKEKLQTAREELKKSQIQKSTNKPQ
ncbi:MAG: hypothetical protein N2246_02590 [Candidatus Sumerlaeia bacterium]|nr:hypothetical protein [Candidatus Sumerlaeia bacterium]